MLQLCSEPRRTRCGGDPKLASGTNNIPIKTVDFCHTARCWGHSDCIRPPPLIHPSCRRLVTTSPPPCRETRALPPVGSASVSPGPCPHPCLLTLILMTFNQAPNSKPDSGNPTGCSPLSDVPSLSYSPSSTESSSSGERTIQMSTFLEDNMVPPGVESTQSWPWLESEGSAASFMMNVDGAPKSSFMGAFYRHSTYTSSSPVDKRRP